MFLFVWMGGAQAQVAGYSFSSSAGTYNAISGGTAIPSTSSATLDDNVQGSIGIGFTFNYNGTNYTEVGYNANGWISLGSATPTSSLTPISGGSTNNVISAFGVDLIGRLHFVVSMTSGSNVLTVTSGNTSTITIGSPITGTGIAANTTVTAVSPTTITMSNNASSTGTGRHGRVWQSEVRYETLGSAPNRKFVFQFKDFSRYSMTASNGDALNFQIVLNETTNKVDIIYNCTPPSAAGTITPQVGLRGSANTDYNNRTTTTDWSSTTAGSINSATCSYSNTVYPASGQTFTWTPPLPCTGTPSAGSISGLNPRPTCGGSAPSPTTVTVTGQTTGVTGISFQWETSTDNVNWTDATGTGNATITYTLPSHTAGQTEYYRLKATCANSGLSGYSDVLQVTDPAAPATQASNISTSALGNTTATITWTNGSGTRRYVVLNTTNSFTDPVDGSGPALTANAAYAGSGQQIVFDGTGTSVSVTGLSQTTTYYVRVYEYIRCGSSAPYSYYYQTSTGTNNPGSFTTTLYCTPTTSSGTTYYISNFTTTAGATNINNTSGGNASGYQDFSGSVSMSASQGDVINYSMTVAGSGTYGRAIWIDFNQNGIFEAGEQVVTSSSYASSPLTGTFTISPTATLGMTRMRILASYSPSNPSNSCSNATGSGEYEDYTINILAPPSCPKPTAFTLTSTTSNSASFSWTSAGSNFQVEYGPTGFSHGTGTVQNVIGSTSTTISGLTGITYDAYVRQDCGSGDYSDWVGPNSFIPMDIITYSTGNISTDYNSSPTTTSTSSCPGTLTINVPNGKRIALARTVYSMTSLGSAYMSEQRSYLYSTTLSEGESSITSGVGSSAGTYNYPVRNLSFLTGKEGTIDVQLRAFRTYGGSGCNATYAYVVNNTWAIGIVLEDAPTCYPPSAVTVTSLNETTVGLGWTPPVTPPANGYEYELRTSGAAGSGPTGLVNNGTSSGTSISFSSLTAGTQYTFYIRSDCGGGDYSTWASQSFTPIGCISFTQAPADGATGVSVNPITFNWNTVPGMTSYDYYWGSINPPNFQANINLTPPIILTPSFATEPFGQTFYWKFEPKAADGSKAIPACAIQSFTYEANPLAGSCISSPYGQYPSSTFVPSCTGAEESITTLGYAGEYSVVTLTAGFTYTFSSSINTDIITIGAPLTPVATGIGSVTYTAAVTGNYRFYTHITGCGAEAVSRTRKVACVVVNNECPGSINLTPVAGKFTDPGQQSLASATYSGVAESCANTYTRDMWYVLTTDNDSEVNENFTVTVTPSAGTNIGLALYDGSCGSLNELACTDANGAGIAETITYNDPFTGGNIEVRGNKTYYLRVMLVQGSTVGTFTVNANGPALPVQLISFSARAINGKQVGLNWNVAAESLLDGYIVEHSTDGRNFEAIGKVKAAQKSAYAFVHDNPAQGINYYRLRMLDDNGAFKLSEVRQVVFTNGRALSLYPNPTSGLVYVSGLEGVKEGAYVNIYNEMGMSVFSGKIGGDELASKGIDMSLYATGAYVIRVISDEVNTTMRFVKE